VTDASITGVGAVNLDVSQDGTMTYVRGTFDGSMSRTLLWVDRDGREDPLPAPPRAYAEARISPDGSRIALDVRDQENDLWLWDVMRATLTRLTFGPGLDRNPVWMPDGAQLAYSTGEPGQVALRRFDGTGTPTLFDTGLTLHRPKAVSADGKALVVWEQPAGRGTDLLTIPMVGGSGIRAQPLLESSYNEDNAAISPDGRWLAYQSDESGTTEVYVRPYPDIESGRWQISNGGGSRPVWSPAGGELFFLDSEGIIAAVPIDTRAAFTAGAPKAIHNKRYYPGPAGRGFDVARDGRRFLVIQETSSDADRRPASLVLVQNWFDELSRLLPAE
jgi:serine/threonine-protein kinase